MHGSHPAGDGRGGGAAVPLTVIRNSEYLADLTRQNVGRNILPYGNRAEGTSGLRPLRVEVVPPQADAAALCEPEVQVALLEQAKRKVMPNAVLEPCVKKSWAALRSWGRGLSSRRDLGVGTREMAVSLVGMLDAQYDVNRANRVLGGQLMESCLLLAQRIVEGER